MTIPRPHHPARPTLLLVSDPGDPRRLRARPTRSRDRLAARLLAPTLDRRLAAGDRPESDPLLATRAQALVAPEQRRALAHHWEHLQTVARTPPSRHLRRIPLCRDRITAAEAPLRDMLAALVAPVPVPVRGVARAALLLSDGSGPLYNRRAPADLGAAAREVTDLLDPSTTLLTSA